MCAACIQQLVSPLQDVDVGIAEQQTEGRCDGIKQFCISMTSKTLPLAIAKDMKAAGSNGNNGL